MTATILLIGAGGIGSPAALVLAHAHAAGRGPPFELLVADDDLVERSNLHRQILFEEGDVGRDKLDAMASALGEIDRSLVVRLHRGRLVPDVARALVGSADIVIDATDNFASRFLAADASLLERRPVVHAASVRWNATVLASAAEGRPCYRCLFEDLPEGPAPDCATAGVVGPICGVAGAIAADLALRILRRDESAFGWVYTFDGRRDRLRRVAVRARPSCPLCGSLATERIERVDAERYVSAACQA
jgi:molybdopterin/thiamine biosynthesis adenylyltransferase